MSYCIKIQQLQLPLTIKLKTTLIKYERRELTFIVVIIDYLTKTHYQIDKISLPFRFNLYHLNNTESGKI